MVRIALQGVGGDPRQRGLPASSIPVLITCITSEELALCMQLAFACFWSRVCSRQLLLHLFIDCPPTINNRLHLQAPQPYETQSVVMYATRILYHKKPRESHAPVRLCPSVPPARASWLLCWPPRLLHYAMLPSAIRSAGRSLRSSVVVCVDCGELEKQPPTSRGFLYQS